MESFTDYRHVLSKSDLFQSLIGMTGVAYHVLCSGRGLKTALSWEGQRNMAKVATASGFGRLEAPQERAEAPR
jgi:hypothetical protein